MEFLARPLRDQFVQSFDRLHHHYRRHPGILRPHRSRSVLKVLQKSSGVFEDTLHGFVGNSGYRVAHKPHRALLLWRMLSVKFHTK